MQQLSEVEMSREGAVSDREFFLLDESDAMVSVTRIGPLVEIVPDFRPDPDDPALTLTFPDGSMVGGPIETGDPVKASFYGLELDARPVLGDFSEAISAHCGVDLRLVRRPENRSGIDRGAIGGATLLGTGSLERLEEAATEGGEPGAIDQRRFRMNFGIDGIEPHEEDSWVGRSVQIGEVDVRVHEKVGRCAATTRDPDAGDVDLKTLHHIRSYREDVPSEEPLPFGVYASVSRPGSIRLGDPVISPVPST